MQGVSLCPLLLHKVIFFSKSLFSQNHCFLTKMKGEICKTESFDVSYPKRGSSLGGFVPFFSLSNLDLFFCSWLILHDSVSEVKSIWKNPQKHFDSILSPLDLKKKEIRKETEGGAQLRIRSARLGSLQNSWK